MNTNKIVSTAAVLLLTTTALTFGETISTTESITSKKSQTELVRVTKTGSVTVSGADTVWDFSLPNNADNQYGLGMDGGSLLITQNGTVDLNSYEINRSVVMITNGGKLEIESGTLFTDKVTFMSNSGTLEISQADAIKPVTIASPVLTVLPTANIYLNASQSFQFDLRSTATTIFTFANNACLSVTGVTNALGTIVLKDFEKGSIYIDSSTNLVYDEKDHTLKTSTQTINLDGYEGKLSWEEFGSGHLLTVAASVPEPAEWAAILGSIALGLAIYRRRK